MTVLDLKTHAHMEDTLSAPICVIGGGMAGLTLAMRLARAGTKVVVLESGGNGYDEAVHELNRIEDVSGRYTRAMNGHYRGVGGSSTRWGGRMLPISVAETRCRPALGLQGWPFPAEELGRYHRDIEQMFGVAAGSFDEAALDEADPERMVVRNDPDFSSRMAKWPRFRNCSLANVFGKALQAQGNVELWVNATVTGFETDLETGRLRAVSASHASGRRLTVQAERFVLAAGTIETTRMLLWLDAQHDGRIFERSSSLGLNLQDHINVRVARIRRDDAAFASRFCAYRFHRGTRRSLHLELTPEAQERAGIASAFAYISMDVETSSLQFAKRFARSLQSGEATLGQATDALRHIPLMGQIAWARYGAHRLHLPPDVDTHLEICAEQFPDERNCIELSKQRDAMGMPKAKLNWRPMPADERTLRGAADLLAGYWRRHDLGRRVPLDWIDAYHDPKAQLIDVAVDYAHPSGTVRMGTNRNSSVVGADLVCHDVPNLSVVSAAVYPSAGSANPTFTLLALAMRHADALLAVRPRARGMVGKAKLTAAARAAEPA